MEEPKTEAQHVVPHEGKWGVRAQNSEMPSKLFDTKLMATAYAFDVADNNDGKVVIHKKDGTFKNISKTEDTTKLVMMLNS